PYMSAPKSEYLITNRSSSVKPSSSAAGMFELVKPPVPSTSPRLSMGPNNCGCTATQLILTLSALAALSRIEIVSCTAVPGPPAIFLPSIDRLANAGGLARDNCQRRLVEADVDGGEGGSRVRRVGPEHRKQVNHTALVEAAGDGDGDIGGTFSGVDGVHDHAFRLEVPLVLRDEERRVCSLDDPIHHDLDVLRFRLGGDHGHDGKDERQ